MSETSKPKGSSGMTPTNEDEPEIIEAYDSRIIRRRMTAQEPPVPPRPPIAGGSGGPHDPGMEPRVAALEADMKDVKAGIGRLEVSLADTRATIAGRIDALTERLHAHGETLADVKQSICDLGTKVDAKLISGTQMFAIFGSLMGLFVLLAGAMVGVLHWAGLLH